MSRVGKKPVPIPQGTKIDLNGSAITVTGPKGTLSRELHPDITASIEGNEIVFARPNDLKKNRSLHGLTRALVNNMVEGVSEGFSRQLEIKGVGYRAEMRGSTLVLYLGYSHPIAFIPPEGITIAIQPKENKMTITGIDKELVGQCAANIRALRKPEPYKGKGIRYVGEMVRTKAGKKAGA